MSELNWLPLAFILLTGLAVLIYAVLDGYDLGVGILLPIHDDNTEHSNRMIASIGPFWDANETWLVLAIGLLLIAFPQAYSMLLGELYLPATIMLVGLILRGVSFDFRAKAVTSHQLWWDRGFKYGSVLTSMSQGYMLGQYVMGFSMTPEAILFSMLSALGVTAAYAFIGSAWLVMKTESDLQVRAAKWARRSAWLAALGIFSVAIVNPMVSDLVRNKWFAFPQFFVLAPIPMVCVTLFLINDYYLKNVPHQRDIGCWIPFLSAVIIFVMCFQALAYSFYPYVIPGSLTIWEAASANVSLQFMFYGAVIVVPAILAYTFFSYRVFWGKASHLRYH